MKWARPGCGSDLEQAGLLTGGNAAIQMGRLRQLQLPFALPASTVAACQDPAHLVRGSGIVDAMVTAHKW